MLKNQKLIFLNYKKIFFIFPFLLFILILFFRFKKLIIGDNILYYGDIETYFIPTKIFIARSISDGKIPLWSQNLFNGYPFFADPQNGTYYPLNVILDYLIHNPLIINYVFIISVFLISIFSYLFARVIGISKYSSIIVAILFSYSGFILNFSYSFIEAYCFIPAILLVFEKYIKKNRDFKYVLISGLLFGFQILAGSPQISFITITGLLIYVVFKLFLFHNEEIINFSEYSLVFFRYIVLTVIIGFLISMIQILPTFIESLNSNVQSVSNSFVLQGSLMPTELFKNILGIRKYLIFGIETPIFIISIILSYKFKKKGDYKNIYNIFLILILISFLIAFGKYFPLYKYFLIHIPLFDKFPLPQRFSILAILGICVLSGISLDIILNKARSINLFFGNVLALFIIIMVIVNVFIMPSQFDATVNYKNSKRSFHSNGLLPKKMNNYGRVYPITGVYPFRMKLEPAYPPYIWNNSLAAMTPLYYKNISSITGTKVFVLKNYRKVADAARTQGLESKLFGLLNLRYIITGTPVPAYMENIVLTSIYSRKMGNMYFYLYLYRLKKYMQRSFLIKKVFIMSKESNIFKSMTNSGSNLEHSAYILGKNNTMISYNDCVGESVINTWKNNTIDINAMTHNNCFLFISNTFFNGWEAYDNGKPTRIYKTDYNFQGIFVKNGANKIRLEFKPLYFNIAELISMISLGNTILLLIYLNYKKHF